ncbi:MAG: HEPN domain-containing protein [Calditrichota bacterium]
MMDIEKHVTYWRTTAAEELEVAGDLLKKKRARQALFFCHLALEKYLKALVCRTISDVPPRIHNLVKLAEYANLELTKEQKLFLTEMNSYNIEGRYPEILGTEPSLDIAKNLFPTTKEFCKWLEKK